MGGSCGCPGAHSDYQPQSFNFKNQYKSTDNIDEQKIKKILTFIAAGQSELEYRKYAAHISQQPKQQFSDKNFKRFNETDYTESCSLEKLYNFSRLNLQKVYKNSSSPFDVMNEQEVQLCYLVSVFYLICQKQELKQKIFVTNFINPHNAYIVKLFCNGYPCNVVLDSNLPVSNGNIKYLTMRHPEEIWPFLLEKAWCKQIGGYDKARGLSPEDCFQQITGIPAYSYPFTKYPPATNFQKILESLKLGYWIALTASDFVNNILPRQVFYIEKYNEREQKFIIRSPYIKYSHPKKQSSESIQVHFNELLSMFEFVTIGTYVPNFNQISLKFSSFRNEQKIFQLNVKGTSRMNIRVIQFYEEYLSKDQREYYKYSPILMELYDENYRIVTNFQGRLQNLEGIRSSNLCENIFETLKPGTYYLRIQIKWQGEQNQASVVIYAGKNFVSLNQYTKNVMDLSARLLGYTLEKPSNQIVDSRSQQIRVRHTNKIYGHILGIENLTKEKASLKIIFKDSYNIRVNHYELDNNILIVELDGLQERVLEILPSDPRKQYCLAPFDIVKF